MKKQKSIDDGRDSKSLQGGSQPNKQNKADTVIAVDGWKIFGQSLRDYLHYQFPATRGHIPLNEWLDKFERCAGLLQSMEDMVVDRLRQKDQLRRDQDAGRASLDRPPSRRLHQDNISGYRRALTPRHSGLRDNGRALR